MSVEQLRPDGPCRLTCRVASITGHFPGGNLGDAITPFSYLAANFTSPTFTILAGSLPTGASLSEAGEITGQFTEAVQGGTTYMWTVGVADVIGNTGSLIDSCTVSGIALAGDLPNGAVGDAGTLQYTHNYGVEPVSFAIHSGALPDGAAMNADGLVDYAYAETGAFSWVVQCTDAAGNFARIADYADVDGQAPQLPGWRYLETTLSDGTNYSATGYDDSAWSIGTAPFGNLTKVPKPWTVPSDYDARFSDIIATQTPLDSRLWLRRSLTLSSVPASGLKMIGVFDNSYNFYINGALASSGTIVSAAGTTVTIAPSFFVVGENTIAIRCDDDASSSPHDGCYFDFLLVSL